MLDPKWYVIAAAVAAVALLANFDLTFGMIAAGLLALILLGWVALSLWLAPESGEPDSERGALEERFRRLSANRRLAQTKELTAKGGSDAG